MEVILSYCIDFQLGKAFISQNITTLYQLMILMYLVLKTVFLYLQILILDEATAAIDTVTDSLVQKTLKDHFAGTTTLTIAHRINTITNCDKVLVLDDGKVWEIESFFFILKCPCV